jgi:2-phospho-L-lactate guanylyltransferase
MTWSNPVPIHLRRTPSVLPATDIHALVPVKALQRAKSRLSGVLAPAERQALVVEMLERVLCTLTTSSGSGYDGRLAAIWVVASDSTILARAAALGARPLRDRAVGLNTALNQARAAAVSAGARGLLVVPADVPLISSADVRALMTALQTGADVMLAGDAPGQGTNALALRLPSALRFRFGVDSFARHRAEAERAGLQLNVYTSPTLALDVDDADSLQRYRSMRDPLR